MPRNDPLDAFLTAAPPEAPAAAPLRKCILTGDHGARAELVRLALAPDGTVLPDLGARAGGRGAWLSPDRVLVEGAAAKGRLRGALMRAFKTDAVQVPADLAERIGEGLARRALDRLGLENRAGHLIWGFDRIGDALGAGKVWLLLHAADAGADGVAKLDAKARWAERQVPSLVLPAGRAELSMALGRENVVHAAVCDRAAAERVTAAAQRWRAFNGLELQSAEADQAASGESRYQDPA